MGRETLHWFRLITPGAIALFLFLTVLSPTLTAVELAKKFDGWENWLLLVLCLVVGFPYRTLNIRSWILGNFWKEINKNIEDQLLAIRAAREPVSVTQQTFLRANKNLLDVFYRIVDKDESLRARTAGVYFNGFLTTFGVDAFNLCAVGSFVHAGCWAATGASGHGQWIAFCLAAALLSRVLVWFSIKRHKDLSNEQLRYIKNFHSDEVQSFTDAVLRNMP